MGKVTDGMDMSTCQEEDKAEGAKGHSVVAMQLRTTGDRIMVVWDRWKRLPWGNARCVCHEMNRREHDRMHSRRWYINLSRKCDGGRGIPETIVWNGRLGDGLNKVRHSIHAGRDRQFADRSKQQDQSREVKSQVAEVVAKWVSVG